MLAKTIPKLLIEKAKAAQAIYIVHIVITNSKSFYGTISKII